MDIKTFLATYWIYIVAVILAIWNFYIHLRTNKIDRKKNLQTAYIELTGILNNFQVKCLNNFLIGGEFMKLNLFINKEIDKADIILENIPETKRAEIIEMYETLVQETKQLQKDLNETEDLCVKEILVEKIKDNLVKCDSLIDELDEDVTKREQHLRQTEEIQKLTTSSMIAFQDSMPLKVISISEVISNTIDNLKLASAWKLIGSKAVIKTANQFEASCLNTYTMVLKLIGDRFHKAHLEDIIKSPEFIETWKLSEEAIQKMRCEVF